MKLILVGGFLGAGKTTLLAEVARRLAAKGQRVGLITNDQAPELVDTAMLSREQAAVAEVSGSCFCCNFPGLLGAMAKLRMEAQADVLVAEPVGSCTDLSATIVQPLKDLNGGEVSVAPLSVLADPARLAKVLAGGNGGLHPSAAYIFRKQLEEADTIVLTKADLLSAEQQAALREQVARAYPLATVRVVSAQTGEGVGEWLDETLRSAESGQRIAEVDYDTYAEGEAVLGWLNATYRLHGPETDWLGFLDRLLGALAARFDAAGMAVGHVKAMVEAGGDFAVGNLTGSAETLRIRGSVSPTGHARLTLNARVETSPEALNKLVAEELAKVAGGLVITTLASKCLMPGRPEPTHRYEHLVSVGQLPRA